MEYADEAAPEAFVQTISSRLAVRERAQEKFLGARLGQNAA
jgi:hypothetical protein